MLHRTKKENDINEGKWIGVGGKMEGGESPEVCVLREVEEETGYRLTDYRLRGLLTFSSEGWEDEYIFVFSADGFEGTMTECKEGKLCWIDKGDIMGLNLWEGDRIFLRLLAEDTGFFSVKLMYSGDILLNHEVKIYSEPNTHSKVIGTIKKGEAINWISKSICEEKEWIRCGRKNNFGYIIGNNSDGTCTLKADTIQEKKEEKIENNFQNFDESLITKEEMEIANKYSKEILEEDNDKKDEDKENNESNSLSTEANNNSSNNDIFEKLDDNLQKPFDVDFDEVFKDDNIDNLYYNGDASNLDGAVKEEKKLVSNLLNMMETDEEQKNNISKALHSIKDIFPQQDNSFNSNNKDLLLSMLNSIPGGKKKEDNTFEKSISILDATAKQLQNDKGSVRLTNGKYNGNNISPKYYGSGWNGGSKAVIKTCKLSEIGNKIKGITNPINGAIKLNNISEAILEDGGKIGDKSKEALAGAAGSKVGEKIGVFIVKNVGKKLGPVVSLFPAVRGIKAIYTIAKLAGAAYITLKCSDIVEEFAKDVAKKITGKKEDKKSEKDEDKK